MSSFEKVGDGYSLDLTLDEAHILINLVEQLLELLGEGDFFHLLEEVIAQIEPEQAGVFAEKLKQCVDQLETIAKT